MHSPYLAEGERLSDLNAFAFPYMALDIGRNFEVSTSTLLQACYRSQQRAGEKCPLTFDAGHNAKVIMDDVFQHDRVPECVVQGELDGYDNRLRAERNLMNANDDF
jgi:hypothetical protein